MFNIWKSIVFITSNILWLISGPFNKESLFDLKVGEIIKQTQERLKSKSFTKEQMRETIREIDDLIPKPSLFEKIIGSLQSIMSYIIILGAVVKAFMNN